ncbi:MAG: protein arginine kinase, partial [Clostridia bacterium]|nr:protein arginine kinase [Clostridia bacterium]
AELPFPAHMTQEQTRRVIASTHDALLSADAETVNNFEFFEMERLTPARAMSLAERHLVSPEFARDREGRALLLSKDESVSIMINEEDHIRIQTMLPGMQLKEALAAANRYDDLFDEKLHYAFDENLGYLTRCPTNLGTGLRASLMLHLPALAASGAIAQLAASISRFGLTLRGSYGEGSQAAGSFFQISNQITLGITESEAIEKLAGIAMQIISQERSAREEFHRRSPQFEDKIFRSLGTLCFARMLSADECVSLISDVRLGVTMGIVKEIDLNTINTLMSEVQPATLMTAAGKNLDTQSRDLLRAQKVRGLLEKK